MKEKRPRLYFNVVVQPRDKPQERYGVVIEKPKEDFTRKDEKKTQDVVQ